MYAAAKTNSNQAAERTWTAIREALAQKVLKAALHLLISAALLQVAGEYAAHWPLHHSRSALFDWLLGQCVPCHAALRTLRRARFLFLCQAAHDRHWRV